MKNQVKVWLQQAVEKLQQQGVIAENQALNIQVDNTRDAKHGDFATNLALMLAKPLGKSPRDVAQQIIEQLPDSPQLEKVEIAGPGFINFFVKQTVLFDVVKTILQAKETYGTHDTGKTTQVLLEFVSANPTGPLHVGHGRGAAYGSCIARLLKAIGHTVHCEYYVNDAGRQMNILAVSVWLRYLELHSENIDFPKNGYKGDYVKDIAQQVKDKNAGKFVKPLNEVYQNIPENTEENKETHIDKLIENAKTLLADDYNCIFQIGLKTILDDIREDLAEFNVHFDEWFSEKQLADNGATQHCFDVLAQKGLTYEKDGALWFKSSEFGDEKDRVIQRANGDTTYFASDIAYHLNKLERGYTQLIDVLGADHHGYVPRVKASMQALTQREDTLRTPLVQFVSLFRGKEKLSMSTRSGSFITLRELREEVGNDAARYFYIMRKVEQPFDFDLELAKSQSNENPVYYIQYAHARICSVLSQLVQSDWQLDQALGLGNLDQLDSEQEKALANLLQRYPEMLLKAAERLEPHSLAHYLYELANLFHTYYNASKFLVENDAQRNARLCLILAIRQVLQNGLDLLGISAPEKM